MLPTPVEMIDLAARARAIRFPRKAIAEAAKVNANTVSRTLNGATDPRRGTDTSIASAIAAEEQRLRDYLIDLHGLPERDAFVIGGSHRRVVKPAVDVKETA